MKNINYTQANFKTNARGICGFYNTDVTAMRLLEC